MVDEDFMRIIEVDFVVGCDFLDVYGSDDIEVFILNEMVVKMIGWIDDLIGKGFEISEYNDGIWVKWIGKIVGVVEDFNMEFLYNKVELVVYYIFESWLNWMILCINGS